MIIKLFLITLILAIILITISQKQTQKVRAWKKIFFIMLLSISMLFIIFPDTTNKIANSMGVGRGADLILYFLAIGFLFMLFETQAKFQQQQDTTYKLARAIALNEAIERYELDK